MTTTPAPDPDAPVAEVPAGTIMDPASGELLDLVGLSTRELVAADQRVRDLVAELGRFRQAVVNEVAARLDRANTRTDIVGRFKIETNAPSSDEYLLDVLEKELRALVAADVLDEAVVAAVVVQPPPKPQDKKVDKREVNKLKGHDDRRVLAAVSAARQRKPNTRTLTVKELEGGQR